MATTQQVNVIRQITMALYGKVRKCGHHYYKGFNNEVERSEANSSKAAIAAHNAKFKTKAKPLQGK